MLCSICTALGPVICHVVYISFSPAVLSLTAVCRSNGITDMMHLGCVPQVGLTINQCIWANDLP